MPIGPVFDLPEDGDIGEMKVPPHLRPLLHHPEVHMLVEANEELNTEVQQLQAWKAEALQVLEGWEKVWKAAGEPGRLGQSKSAAVVAEITRLKGLLVQANEAFDECTGGYAQSLVEDEPWRKAIE